MAAGEQLVMQIESGRKERVANRLRSSVLNYAWGDGVSYQSRRHLEKKKTLEWGIFMGLSLFKGRGDEASVCRRRSP